MPIPLLTATTTAAGWDPARIVALLVAGWLAWRLALIVLFPFGPHPGCKGSGKRWNGKHFRPCRGCKGTGRRVRLGRRVWNWTTRSKESA